jgi:FtsZ-interacting cell division protein ZipA
MSKAASLSSVVAKKGGASPPSDAEGRVSSSRNAWAQEHVQEAIDDPRPSVPHEEVMRKAEAVARQETKEARKEEKKEVARRRAWDGQDDIVKANYEVPRRIQTKLHTLKTWGRVRNIKGFVSETLEKALDREIAAAEQDGY